MDTDDRLARRLGLLQLMPQILKEVSFAKLHKDNFSLPKQILWKCDEEKGTAQIK